MGIGASVGKGGVNDLADVLVVQHLLNAWLAARGQAPLPTTGTCGGRTIDAIAAYQGQALNMFRPDGLIGPGGRTWTALAAGTGIAASPSLSGARWWNANQASYPNSARLSDLAPPFRDRAAAFVGALREAGANVAVSATRRNAVRAYLMHHSWRVAQGAIAPKDVPAMAGCRIQWDHGDPVSSRKGAREMVDLFQIAFKPSLTSRHIEGRAIDMTIGWKGTLRIHDATGKARALAAPRDGAANRALHAIGATYGVIKLLGDPPHWSDDGH